MHELSIALSLIDIAEEESERLGGARILAVHLKVGPLSGVVPQALLSAYELAREGSVLEHSQLAIDEVPLIVFCQNCKDNCRPESQYQLCCSICGSPTPKIMSGRELEVTAMEIEE